MNHCQSLLTTIFRGQGSNHFPIFRSRVTVESADTVNHVTRFRSGWAAGSTPSVNLRTAMNDATAGHPGGPEGRPGALFEDHCHLDSTGSAQGDRQPKWRRANGQWALFSVGNLLFLWWSFYFEVGFPECNHEPINQIFL